MPGWTLIKFGVQLVAGLGVTKVVTQIIKHNTVMITTLDKILVNAGGIVLGTIVVDYTSDRVALRLDQFADWQQKRKEEAEKKIEEKRKKQ